MKKYLQIDLRNYIPKYSRVKLNPSFRKILFKKAKENTKTRMQLSKLVNINYVSLYDWEKENSKPILDKILHIAKIASINEDEVWKQIKYFTCKWEGGIIRPKKLRIKFDSRLSEWFGILNGDGIKSYKYIGCSNCCFDIVYFFSNVVENIFGLSKDQIVMYVRYSRKDSKVEDVIKVLHDKGYKRVFFELNEHAKNINIKLVVNIKIVARIINNLLPDLRELINKSNNRVKCAYIRGFYASEGSFSCRRLSLTNTDLDEMHFIKNLLNELGFSRLSKIVLDNKNKLKHHKKCYKFYLSGKNNLEKFEKEINFGKHKERNTKLKNLINSINKEYMDFSYRLSEVYEIIDRKGQISSNMLQTEIGISMRQCMQILQKMRTLKLIVPINNKPPYIYTRGECIENKTAR